MKELSYELVIVGGGLSGMCAAIAAARGGVKTALIHNRPMPGGNAGSEIRMHICGADHHMSRPDARETGIVEEILLEHKHRNPGNSYAVFDSILWEKTAFQPNLDLYLNTHMNGVELVDGHISAVIAVGLANETAYRFQAVQFVDATGDGSLGVAAGADYVVGRESISTYGEAHAPEQADHCTMGNSLMFKARDMGRPIPFVKPFWANTYTEEQLRLRDHDSITSGYWWVELGGGGQDTIHDAEAIRDDLLQAIYGVWDHIKNSEGHGAENYDLEWVGFLPGKRESRRMLGDYVLTGNDCISGARFPDAVAYGGWPMDVHTVEGFRNESDAPTVYIHLDDVYTIPYRCLYSRNIDNLYLAGRIISCSHMAFASSRVMGTCAVVGQAVGTAAAIAIRKGKLPRQAGDDIAEIQQQLLRDDCYIPGIAGSDPLDLAKTAKITSSSHLNAFPPSSVVNGISRTVKEGANCWRQAVAEQPWLQLELESEKDIKEVYLTFDSNLSREITISINDEVLARQSERTPPELVKDYRLDFLSDGNVVCTQSVAENHQRHNVISLENPVSCNQVRLTILATHGLEQAIVYEVRLYGC
ncbi:MAG: FAD-dependent oxidoreductase [Oscillospiraceae bacterium]|nr:FAD-dependent oxidoreductase [Oscillospiraceae bacterium]